jgi:iron(III) transport system ATP-binding protein
MIGISLKNVSKSYDGREKAVEDLCLDIKPGSFVCLLGPSGCGKTTTLRMIAGLERVDSGSLTAGDRQFDNPGENRFIRPENRNLGLVFQSYALWPHMTVEENVAFGLRMRKEESGKREAAVSASLTQLRMEQYRKRYPAELSGGQQQRVALARMLAVEPKILLLDEPLSNLDAALRLEMRSELKRLHTRLKSTIIFVTHDQLEAMSLATEIAVMSKGKLEQYDTPMNVYRRPATAFVAKFVGNPPMNMINFNEGDPEPWMQKLRQETAARYSINDPEKIASIGFRSEDVLANRKPGESAAGDAWSETVRVDAVLPTGPDTVMSLMAGNFTLYLVTGAECTLSPGEQIPITVPYQKMHLFDPRGRRI